MADDDKEFITAAIIHGFAVAHAVTAFSLSQTLVGDEVALTSLTVGMVISISRVNGQDWGVSEGLALIGTMAGYYLGSRGLVFLVKWIPGIGNAANAATTFAVTELLGWTTYLLVKRGKNPRDISKEEAANLKEEATELRKKMKHMEARLDAMSSDDKKNYKSIINKLKKKSITEERREELLAELSSLLENY